MGFMSNQWLGRGRGERTRAYYPIPVAISCKPASGAWSNEHDVVLTLEARRPTRERNLVHLTKEEASAAAVSLCKLADPESQLRIVEGLLASLSADQLIRVMAQEIRARSE
jgi:hypothetical protein